MPMQAALPAVLDGMALILQVCTFRNQALAAFAAAALDQITSGLGGHTCTKTVLVFASSLRWLVGPFHLFRY